MSSSIRNSNSNTYETTIVSAFMTGVNARKDIDISKYIEYGKKLLCQNVPKVIFMEKALFETSFQTEKYPQTEFRFIERESIYLYQHLSKITDFHITTTKPEKDTLDFLFVQCNKTEWVRQIISENPFQTKQFTWLDFGIYHIIQDEFLMKNAIERISKTECEKVSIGSCWNIRLPFVRDIYKDVAWFFAGGIFGGEPEYLIKFADYMKAKCLQLIQEKKHLMWETNIWYLVHQEHAEIFSVYLADHDTTLLSNYGVLPSSIVMVSAIFKPWDQTQEKKFFEHLNFLADIRCPLILFFEDDKIIPQEVQAYIGNTFQNISYLHLGQVDLPWSSPELLELLMDIRLPSNRNPDKDTATHLWQMHSKVACMKFAVDFYQPNPYAFVWIDFEVSSICSTDDKPVQNFLHEISTRDYLPFFENSKHQMVIPGCWSKVGKTDLLDYPEKMESFINNIYWRYCGGVMWGTPNAIRTFWNLYNDYFASFLQKNKVLTWEVNFWAWLETMVDDWNPIWYWGDHNDTMFQLPGRFIAHRLGERFTDKCYSKENAIIEVKTTIPEYPKIPKYNPMSASFLSFLSETDSVSKQIAILNTRYINYHIEDSGAYWWPSEEGKVIRTKNIASEWDFQKKKMKTFVEMKNPHPSECFISSESGFSEGIEDIRLFSLSKTSIPFFIGSTLQYSPNQKIRTIIGKYDYEMGELRDTKIIEPPTDTYCEKNWIPIFSKSQYNNISSEIPETGSQDDKLEKEVYYIYKWFPMQIGRMRETESETSNKKYHLEIEITHPTSPMVFGKIRGSSGFFIDKVEGVEGLLGIVHYSEDIDGSRHYFHRLVLLDCNNFKPLKYTDLFYFQKVGVEFCIGFTKSENQYLFWISQRDRDPMMIEINKDLVPRWNTCGRWGG